MEKAARTNDESAFVFQASTAFDLSSESTHTKDRYGSTVNAMSLLLARRLAEIGVPFITVFWKENEAIADRCKSEGLGIPTETTLVA